MSNDKVRSLAWLVQIKDESGSVRNQLARESSVLYTHEGKTRVENISALSTTTLSLPLHNEIYDDSALTEISRRREAHMQATTPSAFTGSEDSRLRQLVRNDVRNGGISGDDEVVDMRADSKRIDWLRMDMRRSPIECKIRWMNIVDPRLCTGEIRPDELQKLRESYERRVEQTRESDGDATHTDAFWQLVATDISTPACIRSPHFCFKNLGKLLTKHIQDNTRVTKGGTSTAAKRRR